jgi:PAS domain S-box-containing protein
MDTNAFIIQNLAHEHLAATLTCIGDGIISTDLEGNVIFMNKSAEELTGWKLDDALGNNLIEILPIIDGDNDILIDNLVKAAIEAEVTVGLKNNAYFKSKDGLKKYLSANCSPNKDFNNHITGTVIAVRDISKIKSVDEELIVERNNFRAMFESSPMGIAVVDNDMVIKQVNPAFLKIFSKRYDDILNQRFGNILSCVNRFNKNECCGYSENCKLCKIRNIVGKVIETKLIYNEDRKSVV